MNLGHIFKIRDEIGPKTPNVPLMSSSDATHTFKFNQAFTFLKFQLKGMSVDTEYTMKFRVDNVFHEMLPLDDLRDMIKSAARKARRRFNEL